MRGKVSSGGGDVLYSRTALAGAWLAFGLGLLAALPAQALPQGGKVAAGWASIQEGGAALTVQQYTDRFVGDGIYDQAPVYADVVRHSPGAQVIIPPLP